MGCKNGEGDFFPRHCVVTNNKGPTGWDGTVYYFQINLFLMKCKSRCCSFDSISVKFVIWAQCGHNRP